MRPPWFEAGPALAAAGLPITPTRRTPPIIKLFRGIDMSDCPYAFVAPPQHGCGAQPLPVAHPSLSALADAIERQRGGRPIQLVEVEDFELEARPGEIFTAVQILVLNMGNDAEALLGTAWLKGRGRTTLEPALNQARIRALHQLRAA